MAEHSTGKVESVHNPTDAIFSLVLIFTGGAFFYFNVARFKLPFTVIMFIYGLLMGTIGNLIDGTKYGDIFYGLDDISPHVVLHVFLPLLIFEGSFNMKTNAFWAVFSFVSLLAGPGVIINAALLAGVFMFMYGHWSIYLAGLLGAVLSSTDPVAVVALLKDLGVDKRLMAIVDGEAIMNDGVSIILFVILLPAAQVGQIVDPWYLVALQCFRFVVIGVGFGWFMGFCAKVILERSRTNELVQTCVSLSVAYITFFVADVWIGTSGVLAVSFVGVYLATNMPTLFPGREHSTLNVTWHFLIHVANTALFSLVGVVIARQVYPFVQTIHILNIFLIYAACTLVRFIMILTLKPFFYFNKNFNLGIREAFLLTHGGLRGGVGMMLALLVFEAEEIDLADRAEILIITSGIVLITLALNAPTAQLVVNFLGHRSKSQNRLMQMEIGVNHIVEKAKHSIRETRRHPVFANANWERISAIVNDIRNPYAGVTAVPETDDRMFNVLLMRAFKTKVWNLRDGNNISEQSVTILTQALSVVTARGNLITTGDIMPLMTYPPLLQWLYKYYFKEEHSIHTVEDSKEAVINTEGLSLLGRLVLRWRLSVDRDFLGILVGYSEALDGLAESNLHERYALKKEHIALAEQWLDGEAAAIDKKLKGYTRTRPRSMCAFMTKSAADVLVKEWQEEAESLHRKMGFSMPAVESLAKVCNALQLAIYKWPSQIDEVDPEATFMQSALMKSFPADRLSALMEARKAVHYTQGDKISLGDAAAVMVSGVVNAFGAVDRLRGPGDCFNVASAVCRTAGPEYVVTSKTATIQTIPYSVLKDAYSRNREFFTSLLQIAVSEAIAPAAKDALLPCRDMTVEEVADLLADQGRVILTPTNGYCPMNADDIKSLSEEVADATRFAMDASKHPLSQHEARQHSSIGGDLIHCDSTSSFYHTAIALPTASDLLAAIVRSTTERVFFITGASYNDDQHVLNHKATSTVGSGITNTIGPCLLPAVVSSRLQWRKGTALFVSVVQSHEDDPNHNAVISAKAAEHNLHIHGHHHNNTPATTLTSPLGSGGNPSHHHSIVGVTPRAGGAANTPAAAAAATTHAPITNNSIFGSAFVNMIVTRPTGEMYISPEPMSPVGVASPNRFGTSNNAAAATHNNTNALGVGQLQSEDARVHHRVPPQTAINMTSMLQTPLACNSNYARLLNNTAAEKLTRYNPETSLPPAPYLSKLQLRFLVALEQLMAAVWKMQQNPSSTGNQDDRALVAAVTEDALGFLQLFCLESFSAERILYKRLLREMKTQAGVPTSTKMGRGSFAVHTPSALAGVTFNFGTANNNNSNASPGPTQANNNNDNNNNNGSPSSFTATNTATNTAASPPPCATSTSPLNNNNPTTSATAAGSPSASSPHPNPSSTTTSSLAHAKLLKDIAAMEDRVTEHLEQHNVFVDQVAIWRERTEHKIMCHEAIILGMASFASTHFEEDRDLCMAALPYFADMGTMANRAAFDPEKFCVGTGAKKKR